MLQVSLANTDGGQSFGYSQLPVLKGSHCTCWVRVPLYSQNIHIDSCDQYILCDDTAWLLLLLEKGGGQTNKKKVQKYLLCVFMSGGKHTHTPWKSGLGVEMLCREADILI